MPDLRDERRFQTYVTSKFIREMEDAGYRNLSTQQLDYFRLYDINAEFVRKAASEGYQDLSPEELVELKVTGRLARGHH